MTTFYPSLALRPYIDRYVIDEKTDASTYPVYPNTAVVMGFQYRGRLAMVSGDTTVHLSRAGVTGLSDRYKIFRSSPGIGTVLVHFARTGAAAFFDLPVHELFGGSYPLTDFFQQSHIAELEERLSAATTHPQRINVIDNFLLSRLRDTREDQLVTQALNTIEANNGNIRMAALSSTLNISISRLEKRFRKMVGASPKKYASIVRFNTILKHRPLSGSLTEVAYDAGYFDQAHFVKDFKMFTGVTPEQYFFVKF